MRKALLTALFLACTVTLAACGQSNLDRANGEWTCDVKASFALRPAMDNFTLTPVGTEDTLRAFELSIDAKGKLMTLHTGEESIRRNINVVSDRGTSLVLTTPSEKIRIQFTTNDSFILYVEPYADAKIVFTRKK